jgi:hypothetical protein
MSIGYESENTERLNCETPPLRMSGGIVLHGQKFSDKVQNPLDIKKRPKKQQSL